MTKYDPYSYGQVNLGGAKKAAPTQPDDILFAEPAHAAPKKAPAADSSWELLDADVESLLPNAGIASGVTEFGTDILGETGPEPVAPTPAARPRAAAVTPRQPGAPKGAPAAPVGPPTAGQVRRTVGARPAEPEAVPTGEVHEGVALSRKGSKPGVRPLPQRAARVSSVLVPAALFAGGGTGAAWLYAMEQNLVLAGIVGALSLVAAAFTWIWLRG